MEAADVELLQRFCARRDEAAFRTLVERHAPMVLAVCRRVLYDRHAAEDALQATFLVLAKKARTIGRPELLGNWLHGVAYRVAYKLKSQALRRRAVEARALPATAAEPSLQAAWREVQEALDEELHRLPETYRTPLVLVYLEGKTHEEAAALLGCPAGSMSWRLERGREQLRRRLARRGLALSAALLILTLGPSAAPASESTIGAAVLQALAPEVHMDRVATLAESAATAARPAGTLLTWLATLVFLASGSGLAYYSLSSTFSDGATPSTPACAAPCSQGAAIGQ